MMALSANGKTSANAWCGKGLALTKSFYHYICMGDEYLKREEYES